MSLVSTVAFPVWADIGFPGNRNNPGTPRPLPSQADFFRRSSPGGRSLSACASPEAGSGIFWLLSRRLPSTPSGSGQKKKKWPARTGLRRAVVVARSRRLNVKKNHPAIDEFPCAVPLPENWTMAQGKKRVPPPRRSSSCPRSSTCRRRLTKWFQVPGLRRSGRKHAPLRRSTTMPSVTRTPGNASARTA